MKVSNELIFEHFELFGLIPETANCVEIERARLWLQTPFKFSEPKIKWLYDKPIKVV
jgi:hypothetical protein